MSYHTPDEVLFALSDPTRRRVFEILSVEPCPVRALADRFPISRPAISQHLKILNDAGLVTATARGAQRIYAANPEELGALRAWLDKYWDNVLNAFSAETDRVNRGKNG